MLRRSHFRYGIPSVGAQVARAIPWGRAVSVGDARIFLPSKRETRTHLVAFVESPYPPRATLSRVSRGER